MIFMNCLLSVEAAKLLRAHGFTAFRLEEGAHEWRLMVDNTYSLSPFTIESIAAPVIRPMPVPVPAQ